MGTFLENLKKELNKELVVILEGTRKTVTLKQVNDDYVVFKGDDGTTYRLHYTQVVLVM